MSKRNRKKQISMSGGVASNTPLNFEQELSSALGQNEYNILKPTIQESQLLYQNAKYYYSVNEFVGALVSYSCASVLINSSITQLQANLDTVDSDKKPTIETIIEKANNILECCLEAVEELQQKVSVSSSGEKKNETKEKWAKRCLSIQPLVLSGKSCIFYQDVIGLYKEKAQINAAFISPLMYPNLFPKTSKGILLFGPPGTGKTLLVKAAVNELQKKGGTQVGVFYFAPSPADLKGKYVGETEKKIEEWFTCASYAACQSELADKCKPKKFISIIFIDEMDSIAGDRSNDPTGLNSNSVNTLLQMMDGISSKENVAVIGVTNYPWTLDSAIIRRFDTQILVGLPKIPEIQELLDYEMNSSLNLKKKISNFCKNTTFDKEEMNDDDDKDKAITCGMECKDNTPAEKLILGKFYKKFIIEYYKDNNNIDPNKLSQVKGIVTRLYKDGFTNSDISRFFRTALRHTGELTVESSLFYSTGLVGDTEKPEKYMSVVTQMSDEKRGIDLSMKILTELTDPSGKSSIPVYHDKPPEISVIEFDGYNYYNIKCILCKDNDMLLNHRLLRGIYIKGNKKGKPFTEDSYKKAFFKGKGMAKTSTESGVSSVSGKITSAIGQLGKVGAATVATATAAAGSPETAIGILGVTCFVSKLEYITRFLAQSAEDLLGGADKDIIIEFDVNFEKIDKTSTSNISTQTLISESNVWCFFESFMKKYNTIYKNHTDIQVTEVLTKYKDYKNDKNQYIFSENEKGEFINLKNSDDNNFYVNTSASTPNDNLVAKFLKEDFLNKPDEFIQCFEKLDKGEYYSLYNYLLLLNLFDHDKISNIGNVYFNKDILKEPSNPVNDLSEFTEIVEYPIFGSDKTIKLKFKKRTEAEEKQNNPRDIIITVEDYIKIIPYYKNYNEASGANDSIFDETKNLIMDFSTFIRLFRRTIYINDVADEDSLKKIELQEQTKSKSKDDHFTYCLIQLYMNGVYKHVSNYRNLTDYNTSTYVLRKFIEIFFKQVSGSSSAASLSVAPGSGSSGSAPVTSAPPPKTQEELILDTAIDKITVQKGEATRIIGEEQTELQNANTGLSTLPATKTQEDVDQAELSVKQATLIEEVLTNVIQLITDLKTPGKSLDDIKTGLNNARVELARVSGNLNSAKTIASLQVDLDDNKKNKLNAPLQAAIEAIDAAEAAAAVVVIPGASQSAPPQPVTPKTEEEKMIEKINEDPVFAFDVTSDDKKINYKALLDYIDLFDNYLTYGARYYDTFNRLFFDTLKDKDYFKNIKNDFASKYTLNVGITSNSWNTQLTNAIDDKEFEDFKKIIENTQVKKVFGITSGGGLTITDPGQLDLIFNGLFDNIYLEYYGNTNVCLHPDKSQENDVTQYPNYPNFSKYEDFKAVFETKITEENSITKTKAIKKYYDDQIRYIKSDNTTNGEIKKKRIFIASQFNFLRIQQLIKSNIFSSLWSGSKGTYSYLKSFFVSAATYSTEDEQKKKILEMLDELKNRNLLLSTIFKDVRAFGFQKIEGVNIKIENDDYSSTIKPEEKKIEWSYLSGNAEGFDQSSTVRAKNKLVKNVLDVNPQIVNLMIAKITGLLNPLTIVQRVITLLLYTISAFYPSFKGYEEPIVKTLTVLANAGAVVAAWKGVSATAATGLAVSAAASGVMSVVSGADPYTYVAATGIAVLAYYLGAHWDNAFEWLGKGITNVGGMVPNFDISKKLPEAITTAFTGIKEYLFGPNNTLITPDNLSATSVGIFGHMKPIFDIVGINDETSVINSIKSFISTNAGEFFSDSTEKLSTMTKIGIALSFGQIYSFATRNLDDEKMINNIFLYQMFNIITLSGKIKVDDFSKSPSDSILSYIESEMWRNGSLGFLSYIISQPYTSLILRREESSKKDNDFTLFNKKMHNNVSPYSLVNLNIPISSFIYAFNEVKATADTDLAKDLDDYYENKDLFMERRKNNKTQKKKAT